MNAENPTSLFSRGSRPLQPSLPASSGDVEMSTSLVGPSFTGAVLVPKKKRKLDYIKCGDCRRDKQKCEPSARNWPGQKCDRCITKGFSCSAPIDKGKKPRLLSPSPPFSISPNPQAFNMSPWNEAEYAQWKHCAEAEKCMLEMRDHLSQNICNLPPDASVKHFETHDLAVYLSPVTQYACRSWSKHLEQIGPRQWENQYLCERLYNFLKDCALYWLEALCWMRDFTEGKKALRALISITKDNDCRKLVKLISALYGLVGESHYTIKNYPLQIYYSALIFTSSDLIWKVFRKQLPSCFQEIGKQEGSSLQEAEKHSEAIWDMVFSPTERLVATASYDGTVRTWSPDTGRCVKVFRGHSDWIRCLTFSSNGKLLASGSWDRTTRLWDTATGTCVRIFHGHLQGVMAVAFSYDSNLIASGSRDGAVRVWKVDSDEYVREIEAHVGPIASLAFSPDGMILATASWAWRDNGIKLWDVEKGTCSRILEDGSIRHAAIAFSHDGKTLASSAWNSGVRLWDVATGSCRVIDDSPYGIQRLSFRSDELQLDSEKGPIDLSAIISTLAPRRQQSHSLHTKHAWIKNSHGQGFISVELLLEGGKFALLEDILVTRNCGGCVRFFKISDV